MVELIDIVARIKKKKELSHLDDAYVLSYVQKQLTPKIQDKISSAKTDKQFYKSKEWKELQSIVRKQLRETYGMFQQEQGKEKLLKEYLETKDVVTLRKILYTHQSTQERLPYYKKLYEDIFAITGVPGKIFDIGCGLNPLSYPFLGCTPQYNCTDISSADATFLNEFFTASKITGKAHAIDALDHDATVTAVGNVDIIFLFKVLNTFETLERHTTKKLMTKLAMHTKWLVVSFATISLGGGKFISPSKFTWFENYLENNGWTAQIIDLPNEKFYVIKVL